MGVCVGLARRRVADARSLILSAALTDCCYALLCSAGALATLRLDETVLNWLAPAMLVVAAVLIWPERGRTLSAVSAVGVAALNPATCALWIGLSSGTIGSWHPRALDPLAFALGTMFATALWFTAVAHASSRLVGTDSRGHGFVRVFSCLLLLLAVARVLSLAI